MVSREFITVADDVVPILLMGVAFEKLGVGIGCTIEGNLGIPAGLQHMPPGPVRPLRVWGRCVSNFCFGGGHSRGRLCIHETSQVRSSRLKLYGESEMELLYRTPLIETLTDGRGPTSGDDQRAGPKFHCLASCRLSFVSLLELTRDKSFK